MSLTTIWTYKGPYDLFYMVIYITLIKFTENEIDLATITEVLSLSLIMSFKIFNFEQIKINLLWIYNIQIFTFSEM